MDRWFTVQDFNGCMFLNAASEFPNPSDPVHQAAAAHKHAFRQEVHDLAAQSGAVDPAAFADVYVTLFEGTLVMRQTYGRDDAAKMTLAVIDQLIATLLEPDDDN